MVENNVLALSVGQLRILCFRTFQRAYHSEFEFQTFVNTIGQFVHDCMARKNVGGEIDTIGPLF